MALRITPQLEARIQRIVDSGDYTDASELLDKAVSLLEEQDQLESLQAKLRVGLNDIDRGDEAVFSPALIERLKRDAEENSRLGKPVDDDLRP